MRRTALACVGVVALWQTGCSGSGVGLDANGRPIGESGGGGNNGGGGGGGGTAITANFNSIQAQVFTPICSACHAGAAAPLGLRLTAGDAYAALVNAPSVQVSSLRRVTPGNPAQSYLLQKISGSAAVGARMPLGGPALPGDAIDAIRQWILDGAAPPTAALTLAAARLTPVLPLPDGVLPPGAAGTPTALVVAADAELDVTSLAAPAITLQRTDGEAPPLAVRIELRSTAPAVFAVAPQTSWLPGHYQLIVAGSGALPVRDLAGNALDGDGDGRPGGDFVLPFEVTDLGETR